MMFLRVILIDCLLIFAVIVAFTQVITPLHKRELTFPFFRKLVNKISKPKKENNAAK